VFARSITNIPATKKKNSSKGDLGFKSWLTREGNYKRNQGALHYEKDTGAPPTIRESKIQPTRQS